MKEIFSYLKVHCLKKSQNCKWQGEMDDYEAHKKNCLYEVVKCSFIGCTEKFERLKQKEHESTCDLRNVECKYCRRLIQFKFKKKHLTEECLEVDRPCKYCTEIIKYRTVEHHLEICRKNLVNCVFGCKEKVIRGEVRKHNLEMVQKHLLLMQTQLFGYKIKFEKMEKSNKTLTIELKKCNQKIDNLTKENINLKPKTTTVNADPKYIFKGTTLLSKNYQNSLVGWFGDRNRKWKLIYRGSRDGFTSSSFHRHCDDKNVTVCVMKSKNGNIFGGLTHKSWKHTCDWKNHNNDFIFSLKNSFGHPVMMKNQYMANSIYCHEDYFCIFGNYDLCIQNYPNSTSTSTAHVGKAFAFPRELSGSYSPKKFLAGEASFSIVEFECFCLVTE